ncbi:MAG: DNA repair protein RecO [Anaerolineae bacterium]
MNRERLYRTEGVVLKRSDFGEADRLLTLYTPGLGKIRVLAKGVRKPTSRKAGHVELFTQCQLLIAKGRNLDIVTQAETVNAFLPLREDLLRTSTAFYVAELVDRFTKEGIENRQLYRLLLEVLGRIGQTEDLALTMRFFELRLLGYLGYRPQLYHCVRCNGEIEPTANFFDNEAGGVVCPRCGEGQPNLVAISLNALKVLRFLQTKPYSLCQRLRIRDELARELEVVLQRYMIYTLERNLKSVAFLHHLQWEMKVACGES